MKIKVILTAIIFFITGCMNQPVSFSEAKMIPSKRVYAFQDKGDVTLLITRDKGAQGAGCNTRFYINGVLAAEFSQGEKYSFKVPAGVILLGIEPSAACGGGLQVERDIIGEPGDTIRRRIFISMTHIDIMSTAFQ